MHARSTQTGCSSIFRADAVVMSVPLGVLKASVISFHPPLPEWKTQAIHNLGFGLLNKVGVVSLIACLPYLPPRLSRALWLVQVVLCFEQRFWDSHVHLFGHVATGKSSRGELFMFWHLSHAPVLIALLAGQPSPHSLTLCSATLSDAVVCCRRGCSEV